MKAVIPMNISCRQTKAGNLVISSNNEQNILNFQQQLQNNKNLTSKINIHKIKPKRQKVVIFGAPHIDIVDEDANSNQKLKEEMYSETILLPAIQKALKTEQPDYKLHKILYSNRNKDTINLVIDLTQKDSNLLKAKQLYIGFNRCSVQNFIDTPRCFRYQGHGHIAKDCKKDDTCAKCTGAHPTKYCVSTKKRCASCLAVNRDKSRKEKQFDINHYAYESECMSYRQYQRQCFEQRK